MEFAHDLVDCAPRTMMWSTGVTGWGDLQVGGCARAGRLNISTLLVVHPVFGVVGGLTVPYRLLDKHSMALILPDSWKWM